jgi:hypothetical protein
MSVDTGSQSDTSPGTLLPSAVGWIAVLLAAAYAAFLHHGLGAPPGGYASLWWHPTQFLSLSPTIGGWSDIPGQGALILSIPGMVLAIIVFLSTRSALARALAISLAMLAGIFAYAGFAILGPWELFHWRLSLVMIWTCLIIGCSILAGPLAGSWLRQSTIVQLLIYLPIAFVTIAVIRNATGTDETLTMNFSPWPLISVIGFEVVAYTIAGLLLGLALGVAALSQIGKSTGRVIAGTVLGAIFPAIWFYARFDTTETGSLVGIAVLSAVLIGLAAITRGENRRTKLLGRAGHVALGAALILTPVLAGRAWANADYTVNKFVRAQIAIDALAAYRDKEGVYPGKISTLVKEGYLEELPRPRVGFDILYDTGLLKPIKFSYRGLGSSYVLEFVSTEWIQCAYNPPWQTPEGEEYEDEEYDEEYADEDDESGEAWSCPDARPSLWGDDVGREGEDEYEDEYEDEEYDEDEE